jgi:SAM-dependent methyltransferase
MKLSFAFRSYFYYIFSAKSKERFVSLIKKQGNIFDIGCGPISPYLIHNIRPDLKYTGIDIEDHSLNHERFIERIVVVSPNKFSEKINNYKDNFDGVVCTHNLEHCDDWRSTTNSIINCLKKGGFGYFSFPCEASINFPSRKGTLNFFDDPTHNKPIPFTEFCEILTNEHDVKIIYHNQRYRPIIMSIIGVVIDPIFRLFNRVAPLRLSWALYGFETVIIIKKN